MTSSTPFLLNEDDIWINEDYSNDHDGFEHQPYVYCAQLPWVGSTIQAELIKKQILENQAIVEKIKGRWEAINVDLDAPEDCVKMCYSLKEILGDKNEL